MAKELAPVRRIVTGKGADGQATILEDGEAPIVTTVAARPGYRVTSLWVTNETPARIDAPDGTLSHKGLLPPRAGSVFRMIDIPPEPTDPAAREAMQRATFGAIYQDLHKGYEADRHPGMHQTDTVDYAICMSGEVYAVMEDSETLMKTGDVLVQRGTNHAWSNRSGEICRMCFVLIDGTWS